jgi:hypothetical protein
VEKLTPDLTPQPLSLVGKGEKSKSLSYKERGMEVEFSISREKSDANCMFFKVKATMKFSTLFTSTHITTSISLLFGVSNKVDIDVNDNNNSSSKAVNNSHILSTHSPNMYGMKSFDTAFLAYQMMGLG